MAKSDLSRRERQIMDAIYALGEASVNSVRDALPDPPTRTAVRTLLTILEQKGHLTHVQRGREYIFRPTQPRKQAAQSAIDRVLKTFFDGSLPEAVALHLSNPKTEVSDEELKLLARLIRDARQREK